MNKVDEDKFITEVNIALAKVLDRLTLLENNVMYLQNEVSESNPYSLGSKVNLLGDRLNITVTKLDYVNNGLRDVESKAIILDGENTTLNNRVTDLKMIQDMASSSISLIHGDISLIKCDIQELQESLFDRKNYKTITIKGESDVTVR